MLDQNEERLDERGEGGDEQEDGGREMLSLHCCLSCLMEIERAKEKLHNTLVAMSYNPALRLSKTLNVHVSHHAFRSLLSLLLPFLSRHFER